jgi:outer membrane protein OmpA-like peptidoglycan-associated protein
MASANRGVAKPTPVAHGLAGTGLGLAGSGLALLLLGAGAQAQQAHYMDTGSPSITVDLSVIDDRGYGAPGMAVPPAMGRAGRLLMPGARPPVSRFHAPPGSNLSDVALTRPATKTAAPSAPAPVMSKPEAEQQAKAPPPAKAPRKKVEAAAPPPPPDDGAEEKPEPAPRPAAKPAAPPPPPAVKKASKKAKPAPAEQQAALPPSGGTAPSDTRLQVVFADAASKMPASSKPALRAVAERLKGKSKKRLQLMAYAGGKSLSASKARRLSLSRALAVRSYLIETGVRSTRIDVRALGNKVTGEPANRVDVVVVER